MISYLSFDFLDVTRIFKVLMFLFFLFHSCRFLFPSNCVAVILFFSSVADIRRGHRGLEEALERVAQLQLEEEPSRPGGGRVWMLFAWRVPVAANAGLEDAKAGRGG